MNVAEELVSRMPPDARAGFAALLAKADLADVAISGLDLPDFVGTSLALLHRVGSRGLPLAEVAGAGETPAARSVRDQLVASVLLRVADGLVVRTQLGQSIADLPDDAKPIRLWRHLAATMTNAPHEISSDGVVLLLLLLAADSYDADYQEAISAGLAALGWRTTEGELLDKWDAFEAVVGPYRFLSHAGAVASGDGGARSATPVGSAFAREALRVEAPAR